MVRRTNMQTLSLVIPLYNEVNNIEVLYNEVANALAKYSSECEICFVNDGSTDGTDIILEELQKKDSRIQNIKFKKRYGQDAALCAGFQYVQGDVVVALDGDLQDDPRDIFVLLSKITEGYDVVCGWRKKRAPRNIINRVITYLGNMLGRSVFKLPMHDFNATFKAYKKEFFYDCYFFKGFHRFIPIVASMRGKRICEVEISNRKRYRGKTKYPVWGLLKVFPAVMQCALIKIAVYFFGGELNKIKILPKIRYTILPMA